MKADKFFEIEQFVATASVNEIGKKLPLLEESYERRKYRAFWNNVISTLMRRRDAQSLSYSLIKSHLSKIEGEEKKRVFVNFILNELEKVNRKEYNYILSAYLLNDEEINSFKQ